MYRYQASIKETYSLLLLSASLSQASLQSLGILRNAFLDVFGAVNQEPGFFRPRPVASRTTLITAILLAPARTTSNSVFLSSGRSSAASSRSGSNSNRSSGGNAEFFLQSLYELTELQNS